MAKPSNPFTTRFGSLPPVLGGRDELLDSLSRAQDNLNAPEGTTLLIGPRGMGKTAVLQAAAREATDRGWHVIGISTADGPLPSTIAAAASRAMPDTLDRWRVDKVRARLAPHLDISRSGTDSPNPTPVRYSLLDLAAHARDQGVGVLLVIDELHAVDIKEARELASAIQHVFSWHDQPLAFIGAGLPDMANTVLKDKGMTFFRRCHRVDIGVITDTETRRAIGEAVTTAGGSISNDALDMAVQSAKGYPFQIQLVGFHAWERCENPVSGISVADMRYACGIADRHPEGRMQSSPLIPLSKRAREFLRAMESTTPTSIADILWRTGHSSQSVGYHRRRLIEAGFIASAGRGKVEHVHPDARYWSIRQDASTDVSPAENRSSHAESGLRQLITDALRKNRKISYAQIARNLNISRTYVRNIAIEERLERNSRKRSRRLH